MNEQILESVFAEVYIRDFAEFDNAPKHRFSLKHKLKMRKIFSLFQKNSQSKSVYKFSARSIRLALIIILIAVTTVTAAAVAIHFIRREHEDNTQLFAANIADAPTVIEDIYEITALPEGYVCTTDNFMIKIHDLIFTHTETKRTLTFYQCVKSEFDGHYDNEGYSFIEISVNDFPALYIDYSEDDIIYGLIVWDNGDYIFELCGDLSKDELIALAKSVKIQ